MSGEQENWTFINATADRFERAWEAGSRPRIEDLLDEAPAPLGPALLEELLKVERQLRDATGEDALTEQECRARFPGYTAAVAAAFRITAATGRPPETALPPDTRVGPYKPMKKIGEGGMGIVYMAEQERPVRRRVALKVIKPGKDTAQVIARFDVERQALALMDHPNIARVLDAGATDAGRPFFVMDLVEGVPITDYCDHNRLTPRERLELFGPVCRAIQHAHQKGIIHRDIKPSNVLVTLCDGKPVAKVIDFGVAKAIERPLTEKAMSTEDGQLIGTLEYMSPEQAGVGAPDIDTRSDVYALGVLLYELLTGTTPLGYERLREAGYAEILRRIKEEEPPKPSTRLSGSGDRLASIAATRGTEPTRLTRLVQGDLDWVVMKCLEKDRRRRYETASGLAQDVARYLNEEPVEAGPPSAGYKLKKYASKHRVGLATAVAFLLMLVAVAAVSSWLAILAAQAESATKRAMTRVQEEQGKTKTALAAEQKALAAQREQTKLAQQLEGIAAAERTAAERRLDQAMGAYEGYFSGINEEVQRGLMLPPNFLESLLEDPRLFFKRLTEELDAKPQPTVKEQALLARGHHNLGNMLQIRGKHDKARDEYEAAVRIWGSLTHEHPENAGYRAELAHSLNGLGKALWKLRELSRAAKSLRRAIETFEALSAPRPDSDVAEYLAALFACRTSLGVVLRDSGNWAGAADQHRRAIAGYEGLIDRRRKANDPHVSEYQEKRARSQVNLGVALIDGGDRSGAAKHYSEAVAAFETLADQNPRVPGYRAELARSLGNLGSASYTAKPLQRAVALWEELTAKYPGVAEYRFELARSQGNLGYVLFVSGDPSGAAKTLQRAVAGFEPLIDEDPKNSEYRAERDRFQNNLDFAAFDLGDPTGGAEAVERLRHMVAAHREFVCAYPGAAEYRAELAHSQGSLGVALWKSGDPTGAVAALRQAVKFWSSLTADHRDRTGYRIELGSSQSSLGHALRASNVGIGRDGYQFFGPVGASSPVAA
jgi:serine/threonine protein kinase